MADHNRYHATWCLSMLCCLGVRVHFYYADSPEADAQMPEPAPGADSPLMDEDADWQHGQEPSRAALPHSHAEGAQDAAGSDCEEEPEPAARQGQPGAQALSEAAEQEAAGSDANSDGSDMADAQPQPPAVVKTEPPLRRAARNDPDTIPTAELKTDHPASTRKQTPPALEDAMQSVAAPSKQPAKRSAQSKSTAKGAGSGKGAASTAAQKRAAAEHDEGQERSNARQKASKAQSDVTTAGAAARSGVAAKRQPVKATLRGMPPAGQAALAAAVAGAT